MAEADEWSANATEALSISLVAPTAGAPKTIATFHPRFTYPIFGDDERIFGYKDLKINLRFRANDMRPHVQISSSKKFKSIGETEPADVEGILKNHLPLIAFSKGSDFDDSAQNQPKDWHPPGNLHATFETKDGTYEVWKATLADMAVQQIINRIEIFVPLFIEGGSYIGRETGAEDPWKAPSDADRWTIFFLYRKQASPDDASTVSYTFVGYSTVYRFFYFQPPTPPASQAEDWDPPKVKFDLNSLPCRSRLSQFVILPPFQGKGNGARLYKTVFEYCQNHPQTLEMTVEDPNEAFDDLRDLSDLTFLRSLPEFSNVRVNTDITLSRPSIGPVPKGIVDEGLLDSLRRKAKIAPRQFSRLIEMHTMSQLPDSVRPGFSLEKSAKPTKSDNHQYRLWQLFAKARLYRQNKDLLGQVEANERPEKLNEALSSVELEYARLLAWHKRWEEHSTPAASNGKRKLVEEDEDQGSSKKARVDDVQET